MDDILLRQPIDHLWARSVRTALLFLGLTHVWSRAMNSRQGVGFICCVYNGVFCETVPLVM